MGVFQLPESVDADAAVCLIYSFVCLLANILLIWLIWTHHERRSYVAFISYFTCLATLSSIVQQLYDYTLWRTIMIEQFFYGKEHANDAETQYQRGIMGVKLALSYIRQFCFIVEASLVLFFSLSLAATVYGWWAKKPHILRKLSITGRVVPIALALLSTILLQLEFTHQSFTLYFLIANAQLVLSLAGSCVFLLMILGKYVQTRRQLKTWHSIQYGKSISTTTSASKTATTYSRRSRAFSGAGKPTATFDKWLVIRLSIAFMALCVFTWTNIAPRLKAKGHIVESVDETEPDLSETRAMSTVTGYLSGVSPSILAFIVFGTTKTFQHKMYRTFVPKAIRQRLPGGDKHRGSPHGGNDDRLANRNDADGSLRFPPSSSASHSSFARASTVVITAAPPIPDAKSFGSTTSAPTTPSTPRRGSLRPPPPDRTSFLLPIQEPLDEDDRRSSSAADDIESQRLRRSQIGIAVSSTPEPPQTPKPVALFQPKRLSRGRRATFATSGTFFRDDSVESLQRQQISIPLSRFNMSRSSPNKTLYNNQNSSSSNSSSNGDRDMDEWQTTTTGNRHTPSSRFIPGRTDSFGSTTSTTTTTIWSDARPSSGAGDHHHHNNNNSSNTHQVFSRTRFGSVS